MAAAGDRDLLDSKMPWLLHLGDDGESYTLVNPSDRRCHRFAPVPELRHTRVVGSQCGWLTLLAARFQVTLFNLFDRSRIQLPPITTMDGLNPDHHDPNAFEGQRKWIISRFTELGGCAVFKKLVLSLRPAADSYAAMAIFSGYCIPAFATAASGKWIHPNILREFADIIYHDGKFLGLCIESDLWSFDLSGPSPVVEPLADDCGGAFFSFEKYLVESSGDVLMVVRLTDEDSEENRTTGFLIMKFDEENDKWVEIRSLGDNSLFVGSSCYSMSISGLEVPELKRNCVYFTEILEEWPWEGYGFKDRDVGVFHLEGGLVRYEPPNPQFRWAPPLWVAPNFS